MISSVVWACNVITLINATENISNSLFINANI